MRNSQIVAEIKKKIGEESLRQGRDRLGISQATFCRFKKLALNLDESLWGKLDRYSRCPNGLSIDAALVLSDFSKEKQQELFGEIAGMKRQDAISYLKSKKTPPPR